MSEKDNLQEADGTEKTVTNKSEDVKSEVILQDATEQLPEKQEESAEAETPQETIEKTSETPDDIVESETPQEKTPETTDDAADAETSSDEASSTDEAIDEIDASNAKEAEHHEEEAEHHIIEEKDYETLPMEALVEELEKLVKTEKIQRIKNHVEGIKDQFTKKFNALLEEKKSQFLEEGGNIIDFQFDFPLKKKFNTALKDFRDSRRNLYQTLEKSRKENLSERLEIIEEIKGLLNVEENINTTYKHFKDLQERWRNVGAIPRDKYNNVWNNYHHHVENFYDFLHLNRDLRDLDFKHNLDKKQKIIIRAEELAKDEDSNRSFRELQALHKMWKEELGPVAKEYRDEIWERFRAATKAIHEKRQTFYEELDKAYVKNLEVKKEIIGKIETITADDSSNHSLWQKKIKGVEELRQQFFNAGKVPIKVNEATWAKFKEAVRAFNRKKNVFYKSLKKDQYENLQKKLDLIKIAEEHKESDDFEGSTVIMKKIQSDWKKIGHVPRKDSDKIWNQFKGACNHFFDKLHEQKNADNKEEIEAYEKKNALLDSLKTLDLKGDVKESLETIKSQSEAWKKIGRVPHNKRYIEGKFSKALNALYNKLDVSKSEADLLKFDSKIESFSNAEDKRLLDNEHNYIRKRIDEIKSEINQFENNLQFFSNVDSDNPMVQDVHKKIDLHKEDLETWIEKLKRIKQYY